MIDKLLISASSTVQNAQSFISFMGYLDQNTTNVSELTGTFAIGAQEYDFGIKFLDLFNFWYQKNLRFFGFVRWVFFKGSFFIVDGI